MCNALIANCMQMSLRQIRIGHITISIENTNTEKGQTTANNSYHLVICLQ